MDLVRGFVRSLLLVKRYGFDLPVSEIVEWAADEVCASVLRMQCGPDGREQTALLARNIYRRLLQNPDLFGPPHADRSWVAEVPDDTLLLAYRRLLFDRAEKWVVHLWKITHGPGRRLLKSLKRRIKRDDRFLILRRPNGQFLLGPHADPALPPMTRDDIEERLPASALDSAAGILDSLAGRLAPDGSHGGYCYLMDLVLAVLNKSFALLSQDPHATGAAPCRSEDVSMNLLIERAHLRLTSTAREIIEKDRAKRTRRPRSGPSSPGDDGAAGAWIAIAVEMVMRRFDAGRPEWDGLPQRTLLESLLPAAGDPDRARVHDRRVTYLVRRLRARLKDAVLERA